MPRLRSLVGLLAVGAMLAVAGCGGSSPGGGGGGGGGNQGVGPVNFVSGKDTSNGAQTAQAIKRWNDQHADQKVSFIELPESADAQRSQMVTTETAKSASYDILNVDVVWTAEFAKAGYIAELDKSQFDLSQYLKGPVASATFEDKLWAAPFTSDGAMLYYRKDILDKEGKKAPTSWDELVQDAKTIAPKYNLAGYVGQFAQYEGLTCNAGEVIWGAGGDFITDNGTKVVVDSDQAKAGLGRLVDGFKSGWIPKDAITYKEEESRRAFQQGKVLFMRNWPYVYPLASASDSKVAGKFDVAPLPGPSALGGHNLAVAKYSQKQKTAVDVIKFITSPENQKTLFEKGGLAATLTSVYDDPTIQKKYPYSIVLRKSIDSARNRPITPYYNDVTLAIQKEAYAAEQGKKTPDQAIGDMAKALNTAIQGG
jgi:multiple sugar transport system substrate-binding protein